MSAHIVCPHCGYGNERHASFGPVPAVPHDDDYSLCIKCGNWALFDGGTLRKPTRAEAADIATNNDCQRAYFAIVLMHMQRAAKEDRP